MFISDGMIGTMQTEAGITGNIRAEIARAQLSYAAVADKIGLDGRTFRKSSRGERPWLLGEVIAVAEVLKVPLDELIRVCKPIDERQTQERTHA